MERGIKLTSAITRAMNGKKRIARQGVEKKARAVKGERGKEGKQDPRYKEL